MSYIMVDIEADGPIPGDFSMTEIGAIVVDSALDKTFYAQLRPISEKYNIDALAVTGHTRAETLTWNDPLQVMQQFAYWISSVSASRPIFISDNNGFDFMFISS